MPTMHNDTFTDMIEALVTAYASPMGDIDRDLLKQALNSLREVIAGHDKRSSENRRHYQKLKAEGRVRPKASGQTKQ